MPRLFASLLLSLLVASLASAVTMNWTAIGSPGNACDPQPSPYPDFPEFGGCFGAVAYTYSVGTYEVTNAHYAEFLNAKAASDPLSLYDTNMANPSPDQYGNGGFGGITRSGTSGGYAYVTIAGRENLPVNYVSFYDALRFANWMNNGQGNADTETGAYTLLGGTPTPSNAATLTREAGATIVLSTEDEWYKAAYYSAVSGSYFDYPTGSNAEPSCIPPAATPNAANCGVVWADLTSIGGYSGSPSPYGTYDQGGNAWEWNEAEFSSGCCSDRGRRGGSFLQIGQVLRASSRSFYRPDRAWGDIGFRVAMIPEPSTGLLVIAGLLGLAGWRRVRD